MLKLSKATDYALLFLANLADRPGQRWSVREAAESLNISRRFLANIVHHLARRGIIATSKGSGGGVVLLGDPGGVTLRDVIEVFEGSLDLVACLCPAQICDHIRDCAVHPFWARFQKRMIDDLSGTTLLDIGGHR